MRYLEIKNCRICGNSQVHPILNLGEQYLTGVFPSSEFHSKLTKGPLMLAKCSLCGLVQLKHSYELTELYGNHYGYRSGLNRSMVEHLKRKTEKLQKIVQLSAGDCVIDIGSNDGTTLSFYPESSKLVGFDPSAEKFRNFYRKDVRLVTDFFSAAAFERVMGKTQAKIITSISMFYDLEQPMDFVRQVASLLDENGIWHFEQSYLPLMMDVNAYDTVCHEHLEYYALKQIKWMLDRADLKIVDIEINEVNGGSFAVTAAKRNAEYREAAEDVNRLLMEENQKGYDSLKIFSDFEKRVFEHRKEFVETLKRLKAEGKKVLGYGASTKGNVILQFCGIDRNLLPAIAEVNPDKFGCLTPGTQIPIIPEEEAHRQKPDYFVVLPWHFKKNLIEREQKFLKNGGKMIFPLPKIEIISN